MTDLQRARAALKKADLLWPDLVPVVQQHSPGHLGTLYDLAQQLGAAIAALESTAPSASPRLPPLR